MGCHTICYRPADPSICEQVKEDYEDAKAYVIKSLFAEKSDFLIFWAKYPECVIFFE